MPLGHARATVAVLAVLVPLAVPAPAPAGELYVVNQVSGDVSVIESATGAVVGDVAVGGAMVAIALTPDGRRAYVTDASAGELHVIDTATRTVLAPVPVGGPQVGVAVAPDGERAYVAGGAGSVVTVVDTATDTVVEAIPVPPGPRAVAVAPDGERVYVTSTGVGAGFAADAVSIIDVDTAAVTATLPVGAEPVAITVTPDGRRVYIASAFGGLAGGADLAALDTATDTIVQQLAFAFPFALAAAPVGDRLYVASNRLAAFTASTGGAGASVVVGNGINAIAVAPDGARAYLPRNDIGAVAVVDTSSMSLLGTIAVGELPMGVAIAPDAGPTAAFAAAAGAGGATAFDARHSSDPDRPIVRYDWDFGDGTRALDGGPTPTHVYAAPGTYDVTLTVTNAPGCSTAVVFTGQTASCNGGPKAVATRSVRVGVPAAPECDGDAVVVPHGTPTALALSCRGAVAALRIVTPPGHGRLGSVDQGDATVVYTPDAGFAGVDRIRFAADGPGGASGPATIALTVGGPATAPPASPPPPAPPVAAPRDARDRTAPRVSRVLLARRELTLRVSERASLAITLGRCRITRSGADACRTLRRLGRRPAGPGKVRFGLRPALRRGRYRITLRVVDRAGNRLRTSVLRSIGRT